MVFVLLFVLPTWTVTYGSLDPVLSLACRPWAQTTAGEKEMFCKPAVLKDCTSLLCESSGMHYAAKPGCYPNYSLHFTPRAARLPVIVILANHLEVPSSTLCFTVFICWAWANLLSQKTSLIKSKISGLFRSRIFIRSFMAMMMFWVRSSAPCLELFSAAPGCSKVWMSYQKFANTEAII